MVIVSSQLAAAALARRPLSLRHIRPPLLPVLDAVAILFQPLLLLGQVLVIVKDDHLFARIRQGTDEERSASYRPFWVFRMSELPGGGTQLQKRT
jgi:hypothetical protein